MTPILGNLGKPVPGKLNNHFRFKEATDDGLAVALAGPYANLLHPASDTHHTMLAHHHSIRCRPDFFRMRR